MFLFRRCCGSGDCVGACGVKLGGVVGGLGAQTDDFELGRGYD